MQSTLVKVRRPWSVRERRGRSESKSADGACQARIAGTPTASCNSSFTSEAIKTHRHYESSRGQNSELICTLRCRVWAPGRQRSPLPSPLQGHVQDSQTSGAKVAEVLNPWFPGSENT